MTGPPKETRVEPGTIFAHCGHLEGNLKGGHWWRLEGATVQGSETGKTIAVEWFVCCDRCHMIRLREVTETADGTAALPFVVALGRLRSPAEIKLSMD
jgi:hypothetical protein